MAALLIAAALLGAPAADSLGRYRNRTIVDVTVVAPPDENEDDLLELIALPAGYLLTTDALHSAIKRLYALGRFASVEVYATPKRGTASLRFVLTPIERLGDLKIRGLRLADEDAVREALRFTRGSEIDGRTPELVAARATRHLARSGFPRATASLTLDPRGQGRPTDATLRVEEGPPIRIRAIEFTGDTKVDGTILALEVKSTPGEVLDESTLRRDRKRLRRAYRDRGFLTARVSKARVKRDRDQATVRFEVKAGPRIAFRILGNRVFTDDELMRFAPDVDAPLNDRKVADFVRAIENAYVRIGRFTTTVELKAQVDLSQDRARYVITVAEGPPMQVVAIEVEGSIALDSDTVISEIQNQLRTELGDVGLLDRLAQTDQCLLSASEAGQSPEKDHCRRREVAPEKRWVPSIYRSALDTVAGAYQNLGYLTATVGPPEITVDGTEVTVRIPVVEGIQTFIRSISYEGNEAFASSELLLTTYESTAGREAQAPIQPGAPFSRNGVEDARIAMIRSYRDQGYLYGRVFRTTTYSDDGQWAEVSFRFDEGPQVRINRVLVRGNRFTNESVIRSRISIQEGDIYRLEQALANQRAISELGVFDSVRVRLIDEERPSELKDLVAEVSERNRQPIEVAPGISTAEGPRLQASYTHINLFGTAGQLSVLAKINRQIFFDLYGRFADSIRERFDEFSNFNRVERVLQIGLRSPRYVNVFWEPTARAEVIHERNITLSYALDSTKFVVGFDFRPLPRLRLTLAPELAITDLDCADVDLGDFTCLGTAAGDNPDLRALEGEQQAIKFGPAILYDARDNPFFPTRGYQLAASFDYSIGRSRSDPETNFSPQAFVRGEGAFTTYLSLAGSVLAVSARGGHIRPLENDVPIFERFFLGGRTTLRGFPERALIAQDCQVVVTGVGGSGAEPSSSGDNCEIGVDAGDAPLTIGGRNYALLKAELRLPLSEIASFGVFVDAGNLWFDNPDLDDLRIRFTTGAGIRFNTPVGPLALDLGINPDPRFINAENTATLHFAVGVF